MYALVDGNNFYPSCEEIFNPRLSGKALVVLSNNDGCIIARSQKAKELGIPMGAPAFSYRHMQKAGVLHMLSANFPLYGDLSDRMMRTLAGFSPNMEIYSIDEAFLEIPPDIALGKEMRSRVKKWTGITISVGIASTKTLAKLANKKAKKEKSFEGVCLLTSEEEIDRALKATKVSDLWGIGRGLTVSLNKHGIHTAYELKEKEGSYLKKCFGVQVERISLELNGINCFDLDMDPPAKQSITCSRSFAEPVMKEGELAELVSSFAARTAEKLREEMSLAQAISVYITTSPFHDDVYSNSCTLALDPTQSTIEIIPKAKEALKAIYREGLAYKKAGVILLHLFPQEEFQPDLFSDFSGPKHLQLMQTIDKIHERYPEKSLYFAAQGKKGYPGNRKYVSPQYTTNWKHLLVVRAN